MKYLYATLATASLLIFQGCKSTEYDKYRTPDEWTPSSWVNLHSNDESLSGVSMRFEKDRVHESFPYMVLYVFWDGSVRQIEHERSGKQINDFYWPDKIDPTSTLWAVIDYRKGSDPEFKRHDDPRRHVERSSLEKLSPKI